MTRRCELTGKLPMAGQLRSHAENKTKRTFRPNLCDVTLISDALQRKVRLRISAHALKTVERRGGLDAFLLKAGDEELSERCLKLKRDIKKARAEQAYGVPPEIVVAILGVETFYGRNTGSYFIDESPLSRCSRARSSHCSAWSTSPYAA